MWDREDIALDFEFVEDKFVKWTLNVEPVWEEFYTHKEVTSVLNREYVKESTNSNQNLLSKLPITLEQVKYLHNQLFTFVCKRRPKNTEAAPSDDILSKMEAVYSDFPSEFIVRRTQLKSAANVWFVYKNKNLLKWSGQVEVFLQWITNNLSLVRQQQ